MSRILTSLVFIFFLALTSCIKDDFVDDTVDPEVRITNKIDSLSIDSVFALSASFFNEVGQSEEVDIDWSSSDDNVVSVDDQGTVTGVSVGSATITASYIENDTEVADDFELIVVDTAVSNMNSGPVVKTGTVQTTSSYPLSGSYTLEETDTGIKLSLSDDYTADDGLPGLYIYLSNNAATISNALEIGPVEVFEGAHEYEIEGVGINDYSYILYFCKPFNVKVGDGEIPM